MLQESDPDLRQMARGRDRADGAGVGSDRAGIEVLLLPKDPNDEKNIVLEIRKGAGGDEASLFA